MGSESAPAADGRADTDLGLALLLAGGALCNDAVIEGDEAHVPKPGSTVGDPTETALVDAAARAGIWKVELERQFPRRAEVPFDSEPKRMTTIHMVPPESAPLADALRRLRYDDTLTARPTHVAFTKGAVDQLIGITRHVWAGPTCQPLDEAWTSRILSANDRLARDGMRVLGVGFRLFDVLPDAKNPQTIENSLTFVGLVGIVDPPRAEARDAVATCAAAGIRAVMITGDHPLTAAYIAGQLGIASNDRILTGADLERLSNERLAAAVDEVHVYARVSPAHKLKIVEGESRASVARAER